MVSYSGFSRANENQEDKIERLEGKNTRGTGYLFMGAETFHSAICKLENQESMAEHKFKGSEKPMM